MWPSASRLQPGAASADGPLEVTSADVALGSACLFEQYVFSRRTCGEFGSRFFHSEAYFSRTEAFAGTVSSYLNCHSSSCRSSSPPRRATESACQSPPGHRRPPRGCCRHPNWGCWRTNWARPDGPGQRARARCRGVRVNAGGRGRGARRRQATASAGRATRCGAEAGGDAAAGRSGGHGGGGGGAAREIGRRRPGSWR